MSMLQASTSPDSEQEVVFLAVSCFSYVHLGRTHRLTVSRVGSWSGRHHQNLSNVQYQQRTNHRHENRAEAVSGGKTSNINIGVLQCASKDLFDGLKCIVGIFWTAHKPG